jgi:hypothetical protein
LSTNTKVFVPAFGPLCFDDNAVIKVCSLVAMEEKFRMTHFSEKKCIIVQVTEGPIQGPENIYRYKPKYCTQHLGR